MNSRSNSTYLNPSIHSRTSKKTKQPKTNSQSIRKACSYNKNVSGSEDRQVYESMLFATLFEGERAHLSFDCPKKLRQAFKQAVKANGNSVCHILRTFMVSYLVANHYQKACFNNTMRAPIVVENLVVPSYVKRRVRRVREVEVEEVDVNFYTGDGLWIYRDVAASKLNEFGHAPGCGCKWCRVGKVGVR